MSNLILPGSGRPPGPLMQPQMPDPETMLRRFDEMLAQVAENDWTKDPNIITLVRLYDELVKQGLLKSEASDIMEKFQVQVSPNFVENERFPRIVANAAKAIVGFFRHLNRSGFTSEGAVAQVVQRFSLAVPV